MIINYRGLAVGILMSVTIPLPAEQGEKAVHTLEPITVTAQKRPEILAHVPASVSVVPGEKVEDIALRQLEDVSANVPSMTISQGALFSRIFIRGIGSGLNQGFEQSVGIFKDSVFAGRDRQSRIPLLDVARIEVLKGPQGVLFGKNTTAGAIDIIAAQPTTFFETRLSTFYAPDHGERFVEGVVSGPLSEGLSGRLAARASTLEGYLKNTSSDRTEPKKDEQAIRGILRCDALANIDISAQYEYGHSQISGRSSQIVETEPFSGVFTALDPDFDGNFNDRRSASNIGAIFGPDHSDTTFHNAVLTVDAALADHQLISITGFNSYHYDDVYDLDISALSTMSQQRKENFRQFSQEIRLNSPLATISSWAPWKIEALDYLVGLYYHYQDLDIFTRANIDARPWAALGLPFPPVAASRVNDTSQSTHNWAVFGQATWYPVNDWRVTAGLRYAGEKKAASKKLIVADLGTSNENPALEPILATLNTNPHDFNESRAEGHLMPMFGLQWDVNEEDMVYFNFSTAYKGGGFDDNATSGNLAEYEFGDEFAIGYELGAKTHWLDSAMSLGVALFRTNFKSLQVSQFDGSAGFFVSNAAAATTQGIELDSRWQVTENLTLSTAIAFLDARFDRFADATCTAVQTAAFRAGGGSGICTQDLSGRRTPYAPEWSGNIYLDYHLPLGRLNVDSSILNNLSFGTQINLNFSDSFFLAEDLDPLLKQNAVAKLDLRFSVGDSQGHWELAFVGKNLTNQLTSLDGNDIPVLTGPLRKSTERPRTFAVQMTLSF